MNKHIYIIIPNNFFIDENYSLKVGDTVTNLSYKVTNPLTGNKETLFEKSLTVVSASAESNTILLMDGNKSYYELPRDTFLQNWQKQQEKLEIQEQRSQRKFSIEMER